MKRQRKSPRGAGSSRLVWPVVLGLLLVGLPGMFTFFAEEAAGSLAVRAWIAASWTAVAVVAVAAAAKRDRRMEGFTQMLAEDRLVLRRQLRRVAFSDAMQALTHPGWADLEGWELTVYMYDREDGVLTPVFPAWTEDGLDTRFFEPGKGATGTAWEREELVVVRGDAVSNEKHRLTPQQQRHWANYRRVASHPLYKDSSEKFGVLTALSKCEDDRFDTPQGRAFLRELADTVAVMLLAVRPSDELLRRPALTAERELEPTVLVDEPEVTITAYPDLPVGRSLRVAEASDRAVQASSFTPDQKKRLEELRADYQP